MDKMAITRILTVAPEPSPMVRHKRQRVGRSGGFGLLLVITIIFVNLASISDVAAASTYFDFRSSTGTVITTRGDGTVCVPLRTNCKYVVINLGHPTSDLFGIKYYQLNTTNFNIMGGGCASGALDIAVYNDAAYTSFDHQFGLDGSGSSPLPASSNINFSVPADKYAQLIFGCNDGGVPPVAAIDGGPGVYQPRDVNSIYYSGLPNLCIGDSPADCGAGPVSVGPIVALDPGIVGTLIGVDPNYVPHGMAFDSNNNLYFGELSTNPFDGSTGRLIKIPASTGIPVTLLTGLGAPTGIAIDQEENVYVADFFQLIKISPLDGALSLLGSGLVHPVAVAVDAQKNIYVVDQFLSTVKISFDGGVQTTIGGDIPTPFALAVDHLVNVFVVDYSNNRVVKIPANGTAESFFGIGLSSPYGVAVDKVGNIYITDVGNNRVVEVLAASNRQITIPIPELLGPRGLAIDQMNNLYVSEYRGGASPGFIIGMNRIKSSINYAGQLVGSSSPPQSVVVTNQGDTMLTFPSPVFTVTGDGGDFDFQFGSANDCDLKNGATLAAGTSCTLSFVFTPVASGLRSAVLTLVNDAANGTFQTITLTGVGVAPPPPVLSVNANQLAFGTVPVGQSQELALLITNTGGSALKGTASVSAPWRITETGALDVQPGSSEIRTIDFAPISAGSFSGTLSLITNGGIANVTFTGTAVQTSRYIKGQITVDASGIPLVGVPVVRLDTNLVFQEATRTGSSGIYFLTNFNDKDYVVPVSSGTSSDTTNTDPGPHGYAFALPSFPNVSAFCQIGVPKPDRACQGSKQNPIADFLAFSKPAEGDPPIVFKMPLPSGNWNLTVETGGFAITDHPVDADPSHTDVSSGFYALDFGGPFGTPILAAADGDVVVATFDNSFGNTVVLAHSNGLYSRYAHLDSLAVKKTNPRMHVTQGQIIGFMGNMGKSVGVHLHFQIYDGDFQPANSQSANILLRKVQIETGTGSLALTDFIAGRTYTSTNGSGSISGH